MFFCLSFLTGIIFASLLKVNLIIEILWLITGLFLIGVFWNIKNARIIGFCFFFMYFGAINFNNNLYTVESSELTKLDKQEVTLTGIVSSEIDRNLEKSKITVDVVSGKETMGKILVFADKYVDLNYGDKVSLTGVLRLPGRIEDFDYQGYLAKDGISMTMAYPEIRIIGKEAYDNLWQGIVGKIYYIKDLAKEEIRKDLGIKEGAVIQGMILGDSNRIDDEFKKDLSISGLSHVIAISGSHIVLFSAMLFEILMILGLWRKQAQTAVIIFTFIYVFMTGMLASAVRSAIMISLMFLAQILDRNSSNTRTLIVAASIMALENPLIIKFDLGFQLSFLAVLGLIYAAPVFNGLLNRIKSAYFREMIAMTLSAELFTIPILINAFGYFSVISIANNVIITPIIPLIMATGIIFPFLGIIFHPLGFIIGLVCELFTFLLVALVELSSSIPFSVLAVDIPLFWIIIIYIPIIWYIIYTKKRKELDFLRQ